MNNTHNNPSGKTQIQVGAEGTTNSNAVKGKHNWRIAAKLLAVMIAVMLVFTACAGAQATTSGSAVAETTTQVYSAASESEMFTDRDLSGDYDEAAALKISLDGDSASVTGEGTETTSADVSIDGSTITISSGGTYIFSGTLTDGMIIVEADDSAKVQIVLDGAEITSQSSAAIYVKSADKVFVTTADGTDNTLANGGSFTSIDDSNIDAAVFAKDDITFNGSGTLTITSPAGHGIAGKDDVKIAGGTINITAAKHGVQANDSARFARATVAITAGTDGIHVSDNADAEQGTASDSYFYNSDASITIEAGDDGIHADAKALFEAGSVSVTKSYEGIEALAIEISGGDIDVTASDDGLNAAGFSDGGTDGSIVISYGKLHIQAGGDGIDSNGSVEISGGTTIVEGPSAGDTSVLDYNGKATITGGTFIGTGGAGMAENFSSAENQGIIAVSVGNQSAGSEVKVTDKDGNVIAQQTPELDYAVVYISAGDLQQGGTYTLSAGSYSETIELTDSMYSTLAGGMMGDRSGMKGGPQGNKQGGMSEGPDVKMQGGPGGSKPGARSDSGNSSGSDAAQQSQQDNTHV